MAAIFLRIRTERQPHAERRRAKRLVTANGMLDAFLPLCRASRSSVTLGASDGTAFVRNFAPASGTFTVEAGSGGFGPGSLTLGGQFFGSANVTITGDLANNGLVTLANGSQLTATGNSTTNTNTLALNGGSTLSTTGLMNTGTITTDGTGNTINVGADLFNGKSGVITLTDSAGSGDLLAVTGNVMNDGTVAIGVNDTVQVLGGMYTQEAGGSTEVQGTLIATQVEIEAGSLLTGTGEIQGSLENDGTVNPGGDPMPGDLLITGDYGQSGLLLLDFLGSDPGSWLWDSVTVDGTATLGGELSADIDPSFNANIGDTFDILNYGTLVGNFTSFDFGTFGAGLTFEEVIDTTNHDILLEVVSSTSPATPEPATWWLLGTALMAMGAMEYRRRFRKASETQNANG